ncbi:MAG: 5'-nucleotidase C-terminal domain-containing protein [Prevotella sp.]|nr:5'-nucleotidase C-terminal domain-containing protein [Prevotella sp.]
MVKKHLLWAVSVCAMMVSCAPKHYQLAGVERTRIIVDSRYDQNPDAEAVKFLQPYKHVNDSVMGPVVGVVAHNMHPERPESDLSNLLADILVWAAKDYGEQPVLGVYNMGGIRADLTNGKVTYGDVLDIAPFENKICFVTLTGQQLTELFTQIASTGGEGVSKGTELVISKDRKLVSARLHGQDIDPTADYRVTTINYLLEGNDKMSAFRKGKDKVAPTDASNNTRFLIMNYFKEKQAKGEVIDAKVEGRIIVKSDK